MCLWCNALFVVRQWMRVVVLDEGDYLFSVCMLLFAGKGWIRGLARVGRGEDSSPVRAAHSVHWPRDVVGERTCRAAKTEYVEKFPSFSVWSSLIQHGMHTTQVCASYVEQVTSSASLWCHMHTCKGACGRTERTRVSPERKIRTKYDDFWADSGLIRVWIFPKYNKRSK